MRLPKIAIENYQFVLVLVFLTVATGLLSFFNMPRSEDPTLEFPRYNIVAVYPGTSPQDMEELIVDPIEDAINELEDIDEVATSIDDGLAVIGITALFGIDIDDKYDEVIAAVNSVAPDLPDGIALLDVNQFTPLDVAILQLAFTGKEGLAEPSYSDLIDIAEKLEKKLEKVSGVRTVELDAYPEEEVRVSLDIEKMAQFQISINQVLGILQSNSANIPGGDIDAGPLNFSIKTNGGYKTLEELRETVITARGSQIVYLKDIANVSLDYEDETYIGRFNQQTALFLSVTQKEGVNILTLTNTLDETIDEFEQDLPPNIDLHYAFKQGPAVATRINDFFLNLLQGIGLVGLLILVFLGVRNSLIVMMVIPTSILIAINLLDLSEFGLQQISIAGLVIALGLLVDNGIVVIENITRFVKMGVGVKDAAVRGTAEVGWPIVSSTITTVLAFLPMTQLGGGTGEFIKSMPITVIYALVASLLLSLSFTPLLASKIISSNIKDSISRMDRFLMNLIERGYRPVLNFSLKFPWVVVFIAIASLFGSFALFPLVGISFFPTADKPIFVIDVDTPKGSSLARTNEAAEFVEGILDEIDYVDQYSTNVGHGNPQIYYNVIPKRTKKNHAQFLVNLPYWEADPFYKLLNQLRDTFQTFPGATISVHELKNGPPFEAPIAIRVIGEDLDTLAKYSAALEQLMLQTEGTINVDNPLAFSKTDLKAHILRDKAGIAGVQVADIDLAIRTAMNGTTIGTMNTEDGDEYGMVVRLPFSNKLSIDDFSRIYVPSVSGMQVPLKQVVQLQFSSEAAEIDHYDLERSAMVTSNVQEGVSSNLVTLEIIGQLETINLPTGYEFYIAGEYETQQESFGDLGQLLLVAVLGIFAVLILQFRSITQPFIVLSAIPLAFTGSIVALFLTGYSFSFFAFVGFTSLVGIVVNTSIILVDYTNQLLESGKSVMEALKTSAETRFKPILLTTLTTISGLLPLTLTNSNLWSPMGWTIIGGMVSSTLLTLLIVPILYKWFTPRRREHVEYIANGHHIENGQRTS